MVNQTKATSDGFDAQSRQSASARCIGVFARAAKLGCVKTRIAAQLGDEAALTIYRQLLVRTLKHAVQANATLYLWVTDSSCDYLQSLAVEYQCELREQTEGDLGDRMQAAILFMLSRHKQAILIGSDCPVLTPRRLQESFVALRHADVVLSPAEDGGFVLIGAADTAKWDERLIFNGVRWSTEHTLSDTLNGLHEVRAEVTILDRLWDVDTASDVNRAQAAGLLQWPSRE